MALPARIAKTCAILATLGCMGFLSSSHPAEVGPAIRYTAETNYVPATAPGTTFGIAGTLSAEPAAAQARDFSAMKSIGITSFRTDANWSWVQPNGPDSFAWTSLDREVKAARTAGLSVDLIVDGCPPWAAARGAARDNFPQPASAAQYASWAADVARRYTPAGVRSFEIWNEPNNVGFWQPKPDPAAYTRDLVAAYKAIKAVAPSAFVLSGGLAPAADDGTNYNPRSFLEDMYTDGAKGYFDAVGYHAYTYPESPDSQDPGTAWSQMALTRRSILSIMSENGDSAKKVWITEFGAPSGAPPGVGLDGQAAQLGQALDDAGTTAWIGALYLYTWRDSPDAAGGADNGFGLFTAGGSAKPACTRVAGELKSYPGRRKTGKRLLRKVTLSSACQQAAGG